MQTRFDNAFNRLKVWNRKRSRMPHAYWANGVWWHVFSLFEHEQNILMQCSIVHGLRSRWLNVTHMFLF